MIRILVLITAIIFSTTCSLANETKPSADSYWETGIAHQEKGDFDKALECYNRAISICEDARFLYSMGTLYQAKGNHEKAIELYQKAMLTDPKNRDYRDAYNKLKAYQLIDLAQEKQKSGDYDQAMGAYREAISFLHQSGLATDIVSPDQIHAWCPVGDYLKPDGSLILPYHDK